MSLPLTLWSLPPEKLSVSAGQADLWRFRLDPPGAEVAALAALLSADELARAERLLDPLKSNSFVVARGRLRQILGRYLDLAPEDIAFSYGAHGKPCLSGQIDESLDFNLSHAGCRGLLAVTCGQAVGVDIERISHRLEYRKVAARVFTPDEVARLGQYHPARRRRAFFRIWTRKEAWLKGHGGGFSTSPVVMQQAGWRIRSFAVDREYLGAVAVKGEVASLRRWNLE